MNTFEQLLETEEDFPEDNGFSNASGSHQPIGIWIFHPLWVFSILFKLFDNLYFLILFGDETH